MGNYNQGGRSRDDRGGRGGYGGGRGGGGGYGGGRGGGGGFGGRDRGRPQMHPATCADCGAQCEVPFKPTGEKPVFCSNCFEGSGRAQSRPNREPSRPRFDDKPKSSEDHQAIKSQIDRLESKLDKILKILAPVVSADIPLDDETELGKATKDSTAGKKEKPAKKVAKKSAKKTVKKVAKKAAKKPAKKAAKKK